MTDNPIHVEAHLLNTPNTTVTIELTPTQAAIILQNMAEHRTNMDPRTYNDIADTLAEAAYTREPESSPAASTNRTTP